MNYTIHSHMNELLNLNGPKAFNIIDTQVIHQLLLESSMPSIKKGTLSLFMISRIHSSNSSFFRSFVHLSDQSIDQQFLIRHRSGRVEIGPELTLDCPLNSLSYSSQRS